MTAITNIKRRFIVAVLIISGASILLSNIVMSVFGVGIMRDNLVRELNALTVVVGDRSIAALQFRDDKLAQETLDVFVKQETIMQACLYDETGAFFAAYASASSKNSPCPTDLTQPTLWSDGYVEFVQPIYGKRADGETNKFGYIYLKSTQQELDAYIQKQIMIAVWAGIIGVLFSSLLAFGLRRAILSSLPPQA